RGSVRVLHSPKKCANSFVRSRDCWQIQRRENQDNGYNAQKFCQSECGLPFPITIHIVCVSDFDRLTLRSSRKLLLSNCSEKQQVLRQLLFTHAAPVVAASVNHRVA